MSGAHGIAHTGYPGAGQHAGPCHRPWHLRHHRERARRAIRRSI